MTQEELSVAPALSSNPTYEPVEEPPKALAEHQSHGDRDLQVIYEIDRAVSWLLLNDYSRVALQFPDELLGGSTRVVQLLQDGLKDGGAGSLESFSKLCLADRNHNKERKFYILADTSYGSCCVDEIAAEHADADCIIHYGRACLSPTSRLPVLHIYTSLPLDFELLIRSFTEAFPDKSSRVIVTSSLPYSSHIPKIQAQLSAAGYINVFGTSVIHDPSSSIPNRTSPSSSDLANYHIFHVDTPLTSLLLTLSSLTSSTSLQIYATQTQKASAAYTLPILRRRYALLSHIRSAGVLGILVNTLSAKNYLSVITSLKSLLQAHGKKSYLFVVGKVNAAKVANFAEVECWVVVGCWESSIVDEGREFWRPVVTPWEVRCALEGGEGAGVTGWRADFEAFLEEEKREQEPGEEDNEGNDGVEDVEESEPPVFDLRTGKYVSTATPMRAGRVAAVSHSLENGNSSTALMTTNKHNALTTINNQISPAAAFLREKRGWTGLGSDYAEVEYDRDGHELYADGDGAVVEEGRKGIAKGYVVGEEKNKT